MRRGGAGACLLTANGVASRANRHDEGARTSDGRRWQQSLAQIEATWDAGFAMAGHLGAWVTESG